jgi:transcription termination/antitermination protein NusA
MLSELDRILDETRKDKGIDKEVLINALETALVKAALNKYGHSLDIEAHYNEELGEIELFQYKTVAEDVTDIAREISIPDARIIVPDAEVGEEIGVKMDVRQFGRIAAQTARQVITQNIREAERENIYGEYKDKKGELITGYVHRFEKGNIIIMLSRYEALMPTSEQIPGEMFSLRDRIKGYVLDVKRNTKGSQIIVSRTHPGFLTKLFELEVPEIAEGIVKIHNVAREPGFRAKIAVESLDSRVDPVGACVGNRGSRVQNIVSELHGEKIDIIPWTDEPTRFVCSALAPAEVTEMIVDEDNRAMEIIVEDNQLSLAIGKKGQNVRLAAKLTGWKIDIRSKTKYQERSKLFKDVLMKIDGIDSRLAEALYNADLVSIESVALADGNDLEEVLGVGNEQVQIIIHSAQKLMEAGVGADVEAEAEAAAAARAEESPAADADANGASAEAEGAAGVAEASPACDDATDPEDAEPSSEEDADAETKNREQE